MRTILLATSSAFLLSACMGKGKPPATTPPPRVEPVAAAEVLQRIKREVASFNAFQMSRANDAPLQNACKGQVTFLIDSVGLGMVLLNEQTNGGTLGAKAALAGITLGPKGEITETGKSTIKVNMLFKPKDPMSAGIAPVAVPEPGSLDEALRTLRQTMLDASAQPPCLTFPAEQKNSVEATFQVTRKQDGSVAIEFIVFEASLKDVRSLDTTNTITINFKAVGRVNPITGTVIDPGALFSVKNAKGLVLSDERMLALPPNTEIVVQQPNTEIVVPSKPGTTPPN